MFLYTRVLSVDPLLIDRSKQHFHLSYPMSRYEPQITLLATNVYVILAERKYRQSIFSDAPFNVLMLDIVFRTKLVVNDREVVL